MNKELLDALEVVVKEKGIEKEIIFEAIENSLVKASKTHFGSTDKIQAKVDRETGEFLVYLQKEVVETVTNPVEQISLEEAQKLNAKMSVGDKMNFKVESKSFSRIATQNAKSVILQKINEEERRSLFNTYFAKEKDIVTGTVQRRLGKNLSINLGKADAVLNENEMVRSENLSISDRIKVYVVEVKETTKGPRILVSRTHPDFVKRLFESEVTEIQDGTVEIKSIAREPGSRTKMAVWSADEDVDAIGACVGKNGIRVNAVVDELQGEKIDIIMWNENPALLIENALSPAKVIGVMADEDEKSALVIVPDYQLSLAIGKEGQNARLAAKLTSYKIDIKSESQAHELGLFDEFNYDGEYEGYEEKFNEEEYEEEYEEGYDDYEEVDEIVEETNVDEEIEE